MLNHSASSLLHQLRVCDIIFLPPSDSWWRGRHTTWRCNMLTGSGSSVTPVGSFCSNSLLYNIYIDRDCSKIWNCHCSLIYVCFNILYSPERERDVMSWVQSQLTHMKHVQQIVSQVWNGFNLTTLVSMMTWPCLTCDEQVLVAE